MSFCCFFDDYSCFYFYFYHIMICSISRWRFNPYLFLHVLNLLLCFFFIEFKVLFLDKKTLNVQTKLYTVLGIKIDDYNNYFCPDLRHSTLFFVSFLYFHDLFFSFSIFIFWRLVLRKVLGPYLLVMRTLWIISATPSPLLANRIT